jgi:hypothetical protein
MGADLEHEAELRRVAVLNKGGFGGINSYVWPLTGPTFGREITGATQVETVIHERLA